MLFADHPPYLRCLQLCLQLLLLLLLVCLQLLQACLCGTYLVASSIAQLAQAFNLHACGHAFTHQRAKCRVSEKPIQKCQSTCLGQVDLIYC